MSSCHAAPLHYVARPSEKTPKGTKGSANERSKPSACQNGLPSFLTEILLQLLL